jgi:phosphatidylserine/phosphatidylglycerophosphate/cardiolipin synthase-like enzyme
MKPSRPGRRLRLAALALLTLYAGTAAWQVSKPLPEGLDQAAPWRTVTDVAFLADTTWLDVSGQQHTERQIFDEVFRLIRQAEQLVVLDMFLLNDFAGDAAAGHRALSAELVAILAERRRERPALQAVLITDPFNSLYSGVDSPALAALTDAGISVIETDLRRLRDPNPAWSALWRLCCQWFANSHAGGWLPNPVGDGRVTLRTWLALLNLKANHRKTLVVDVGDDWVGLVTSANPHDASSRHDNVAIRFAGQAALDLLATELAVARLSGAADAFALPATTAATAAMVDNPVEARILTESQIRASALQLLGKAGPGDRVRLAMFYLSHRAVIAALLDAQQRGADVQVLLDPNEDAFGHRKGGIPNRQAALELSAAGLPLRWCNTRGEQCHTKLLLRLGAGGDAELLLGSANFTRRNLDNYNLETSVQLRGPADHPALRDAAGFFAARWDNEPDRLHSLPYPAWADPSRLRYWRYRLMEATGLSTF